jgi:hypothetical protein
LSAEGEGSRAVNILEPIDANQLYRDMSRHKCYVLSRGSVYVLHDPRRNPPRKRDCISLQRYVVHRAVYRTLEEGVDTVAEVSAMITEGIPFDCTSYNDPRVNAGRQQRTVIATASVWKVKPDGYVNIYPNSHIRAGNRATEWQARR